MSVITKDDCDTLDFCHWGGMFGCTPYTKKQQVVQMIRKRTHTHTHTHSLSLSLCFAVLLFLILLFFFVCFIVATLIGVGVYGAVIVMRIIFSRTAKREKVFQKPIN